jgi:hypothetical protein
MSAPLPVLGAALNTNSIPAYRDWLLERQRDLEIQDFSYPEQLDGDWRTTADRINSMLDGHSGRRGIHGPFWGFKIDSRDPMIRSMVTKRLLQGLEIAEYLRATHMVIHSPYTTWDHNNLDMTPDARANMIERVQATLREVIARAENVGCVIVIENIETSRTRIRMIASSWRRCSVAPTCGSRSIPGTPTTRITPRARHRSTSMSRRLATCWPMCICRTATVTPTATGRRAKAIFAGPRCSGRWRD